MLAIIKQRSKEYAEQHSPSKEILSKSSLKLSTTPIISTKSNLSPTSRTNLSSRSRSSHENSSSSIHRQNSDDFSVLSYGSTTSSMVSYKTKYEPQKSIHEEIAYVFNRPIRSSYSRGHEIPEPHSPHQTSHEYRRPHTSGTKLPPCFSPIRPSERSRNLFSRATSPVMLRHGRHIPVDMISMKYKYPLNNISYERPSMLASNIKDASLPSTAENILEDTRFQSIAPFTKRV